MKKIIIGALMFLGLTGCIDYQYQDRAQWVIYTQDDRTHLCYAMQHFDRSLALTNVPCTSEVMDLVNEARSEAEKNKRSH